jgi:hypothetical protein
MSLALNTNNEPSYSVNGLISTKFSPIFALALVGNIALANELDNQNIYPVIRTPAYSVSAEISGIPFNYYNKSKSLSYYRNLKTIESFRLLESNWNGNDADKIPEAVMLSAFQLLNKIDLASDELRVFPTARDSIQFECMHKGTYVEAELFAGEYFLYSENRNGQEIEQHYNSIDELAKEFISIYAF